MSYNKETGMYEGYIYQITNKINNKIYIGQTITEIRIRWTAHKRAAKYNLHPTMILYNAMNKYGIDNFVICELDKIECPTVIELREKLNDKEIFYINYFNAIRPNGYNITKGGNNASDGSKKSVNAYFADGTLDKKYESLTLASREISGDDTAIAAISMCCRGKIQYAYGRVWRFNGDSFDKYKVTKTQLDMDAFNEQKAVDKYTTDGEFVCTYESMIKAAIDNNISNYTIISCCCRGLVKVAKGFVWRYHGDSFDKYNTLNDNYCAVNKYTIDGQFISFYKSQKEAALSIGRNKASKISLCCTKKRNKAYGFKWFYADDPDQPDKSKIITSN